MTTFPHPLASRRFKQQRVVAMCSRCARGNRGFTLIELLVVIAIVVILAALGYTATQKAMYKARSAQKILNLKAIGGAHSAYLADNQGRCLPSTFVNTGDDPELNGNGRAWWCHYLMRYNGGSAKMFWNPSYKPWNSEYPKGIWDDVKNPFTEEKKDETPGELCRIESGFGWVWYQTTALPADQGDWVSSLNNPRPLLVVALPSQQIVCLESQSVVAGPNPSIGLNFQAWIMMVRSDPNFWAGPRWSDGAITCLFFDGHVEAKRPDDFKEKNFSILAR
jgi:prepilin-type N-terminal cleavage/methylation domain-containing protein/prepilin-type processing-associated H-X9-DG protein